MNKTIYSDNTDANGVSYATIGENIRNGSKNIRPEDLASFMQNREAILTQLHANSENLKDSILAMFGADNEGLWGDKYIIPFSTEELQIIKTSLGIN